MRHMGWDYPALLAAPIDVVEEIIEIMVKERAR